MKVLGAVLAGGRSSRFGSDKAQACFSGLSLLDHAVAALGRQSDAVAVVGRQVPGMVSVADWPAPDAGPLGGLAGALRHARDAGFDLVISCGVDCVGLPDDLVERLSPAPAYAEDLPVIGLWRAADASALEQFMGEEGKKAVRRFAERIGARAVPLARPPANINTMEDLQRLEHAHGL